MNNELMFSSEKQDWATPQNLFDELNHQYNFDVDVCAHSRNYKCEKYYTEDDNALEQEWKGTCWMNPPYDQSAIFIEKAYEESLKGSRVVALIPARTDTKYFHNYCMQAEEIMFIKGRLKFGDSKNSAPFPSMLVVFNNHHNPTPIMSTYTPSNEVELRKVIYKDLKKVIRHC
jgi:phage N-6-adenine-methyltransferase